MKTRNPIKAYKTTDEFRAIVRLMAEVNEPIALEYMKLEAHHKEETEFLIKRIEELEEVEEEFKKHVSVVAMEAASVS